MKLTAFHKFIIGFSLSLLMLFSIISFSYKSGNELYNDFSWVEHTYRVIHTLESILSTISETEGNVNGYYINSQPAYLDDYVGSVKKIYSELRKLEKITKDDPNQIENLKELRTLINKRIVLFNYTIKFRKKEEQHPFLLHAKLNEANLCMQEIKEVKLAMEHDQEILLKHRKNIAYHGLTTTNYINIAAALFCFIIAFLGIIIVQKDIRERSKNEKELRKMDENKNKFFSIISHDLRGPMKAVLKLSTFLTDEKNKPSPEETDQIAKLIEKTVSGISALLDNLLTWSKIQMNTIDFKPEKLQLHQVTDEGVATLHELAQMKNIHLENMVEQGAVAYADRNMVNTVLRNLTSNSIKFTDKGGRINISANRIGNYIEMVVEDNGIGMTNEELSKLFQIKTKYSKKGTASEEGSGLGLLLCKEFVEKNGGEIKVESSINIGTKFKFTLPTSDLN